MRQENRKKLADSNRQLWIIGQLPVDKYKNTFFDMRHCGDFQTLCRCSLQSIKESQVCNSVKEYAYEKRESDESWKR